MKTKKYITRFIRIFLLVFIIGCSDFLEPEQINLVYNDVFWKTQEDAEGALNGAYALFRGSQVRGEFYERGDVTTTFFRRGWNGGSSSLLYTEPNLSNQDLNDNYRVIAHINQAINRIDDIPIESFTSAKKKGEILGEFHFLRSLTFFYLVRIWGDVPLVTEELSSSDQVLNLDGTLIEVARDPEYQVIDFAIEEAEKAAVTLDYDFPGTLTWGIRANKASAQALLGHLYLWRAFVAERDLQGNPNMFVSKAVDILKEAVANCNCSHVDYNDPAAVQLMFKGASSEAIFELNISVENNESYRMDHGGIANLTSKVVPLNNDPEKDRSSFVNWVPYSKKIEIYGDPEHDLRPDQFFRAWDSNYDAPFNDVGANNDRSQVTSLRKYEQVVQDPNAEWNEYIAYFSEANLPVFRYSGIKLLLAEALVKNGNIAEANTILDEVKTRSNNNAPLSGDILRDILDERARELIGEGHIFYDWIRNQDFSKSGGLFNEERIRKKGYYWPVSNEILVRNKKIGQNAYWAGKTQW